MKQAATILLTTLLFAACATNPATGKREFNIVSEQQEIAMGQESHQQVIREFGVYTEKPELARRVGDIGQRLAAQSERPHLPWHFTILDTPMINAMALPGGYIYITRGMLERINSDDELAGVLGHEIAHVTARHAAEQMSRAQLAQLGLVLGSVVAGPQATQAYGQIAQLGMQLLFQKYSRSQESQADILGTGYVARNNMNPTAMESMLRTLMRLDKGESSAIDKYFQSHPDPAKRIKDVHKKVAELQAANVGNYTQPQRSPYVRLTDNLIVGNSTQHIVIKDDTLYDKDHGLVIEAPGGWKTMTQPGLLFAMAPDTKRQSNVAFYAQEVEGRQLQGASAQDAIRSKLQQSGLQYVGSRQGTTARGNATFPIDVWSGQTQSGTVGVETTQFVHGDHAVVFMFLSPGVSRSQSPLGDILARTFVDAARANSAQPPRMRLATVRSGDTWASLARAATGNANDAKAIANINGFDLTTSPPTGMIAKLPQDVSDEAQ